MILVMFVIFLFLNQFYQINATKQNVNQFNLKGLKDFEDSRGLRGLRDSRHFQDTRHSSDLKSLRNLRDLKRFKRSDFLKSRPNGVRSCYCKLRSSFPATINEEKLDFVCNCRRSSQYEAILFKQHKHDLDDDKYLGNLPNGSTRSSSRSKYFKSRQRNRDLKNFRFEFEKKRKKQKRKQRKSNLTNEMNTISNDSMMQSVNDQTDNSDNVEDQNEPNETNLNEQPHDMCTCNSQNGCKGNCDLLNGCVCSNENKNECWGSSCFKTKINVPFFSLEDAFKNEPKSSDLIDLIYFANKNKSNRLRKIKSMSHLFGNRLPDQAESSIMSRINVDYPSSILQSIPPVDFFSPVPSISFARTIAPSQQTVRSIILNELESSEQTKNGQCRCLQGRCFGLECENLKGCICDEIGCYGKFCSLFKTPYTNHHENPFKHHEVLLPEQLQEYELASKPLKPLKYGYQNDVRPTTDDLINNHQEYAKESSKTVKCEKIVEESPEQNNKIKQQLPINTNNKSQVIKNSKGTDKDDSSLNAYQMKVIKLTPVSSSQLIENGSNRDQNRIQSETISLML